MTNRQIAHIILVVVATLLCVLPVSVHAQNAALVECAGYNQSDVYIVWDRTRAFSPDSCAPWDGYTLLDPAWVNGHATYGSFPNIRDGTAVGWACTVTWGAEMAADAQGGVGIYIRGAQMMSGAWNTFLIPHYGAEPCTRLLGTFGNTYPYYYRQAW